MPVYKNHHPSFLIQGLNQTLDSHFRIVTNKDNVTRIKERKKKPLSSFSERQLEHLRKFSLAVEYAKLNTQNPFYIAESRLRKKNAFQVAASDYMKTPSIKRVSLFRKNPELMVLEIQVDHCCLLGDLTVSLWNNDDISVVLIEEQRAQLMSAEKNSYSFTFIEADLDGRKVIAVKFHLKSVSGTSVNIIHRSMELV